MDTPTPSAEQVRAWIYAVRADLEALHEKLTPLLEEERRLEARQVLLKELLSSFAQQDQVSDNAAGMGSAPYTRAITATGPGAIGQYVIDHATEILREAGGPLHINDLHARFVQQGYQVPGAGQPVNLTAHLRRATEIVSPSRGIYGLVEHVGRIADNKRRRSKHRSRKR
jgi:hypothetical protein